MNDQKISLNGRPSDNNYDRPSVETIGEYGAADNSRYTQVDNNYIVQPIEGYNSNNNIPNQNGQNNDADNVLSNVKSVLNYKIILLGDCGVGKTSILNRYINGTFSMSNQTTIAEDYQEKTIDLDMDSVAVLKIWDTVGEERFSVLTKTYYKDSHGVIIVFDLTDKDTFNSIKAKINDVNDHAPRDVVIAIVGNKSDLTADKKVQENDLKEIKNKYAYFEVSAKSGNNISLLFEQLTDKIVEKQKEEKNSDDKVVRGMDGRKTLKLGPNEDVPGKNEKNCFGKCKGE